MAKKDDREARVDRIVVLGLGRFGASLARELVRRGSEVLGIDSNPTIAQRYADELTHTAVADTTDAEVLRQLDVPQFRRAVVGIGTDLEASILTTASLVDALRPISRRLAANRASSTVCPLARRRRFMYSGYRAVPLPDSGIVRPAPA